MNWGSLFEEKDQPGRASASRLLMLLGGAVFAALSLGTLTFWAFILTGRWLLPDTEAARDVIELVGHMASLAVALAAPYAVGKLPTLTLFRRALKDTPAPASDAQEPPPAG